MFKAATLICRTPDGSLISQADASVEPLLETAKASRVSGTLDGVPIAEGVVMANWRNAICYAFKVDTTVQSAAVKKPRKRKDD
jgi:hypothetical protein